MKWILLPAPIFRTCTKSMSPPNTEDSSRIRNTCLSVSFLRKVCLSETFLRSGNSSGAFLRSLLLIINYPQSLEYPLWTSILHCPVQSNNQGLNA